MKQLLTLGALVTASLSFVAHAETQVAPQVLRDQFRAAALEFSVPQEVLETIAYVETNWRASESAPADQAGTPAPDSNDDHGPIVYGVMALTEAASARSVDAAAALLGQKPAALKNDSRQNIRGGAALLARLAQSEKLASFGDQLNEKNLGGWMRIVAQFSGLEAYKLDAMTGKTVRNPIEEDRQRASYAEGVLIQMRQGFEVDGVIARPLSKALTEATESALRELRARIDFLSPLEQLTAKLGKTDGADFPGAKFKASPWVKVGGPAKKYIVIHSTEGAYAGAVNHLTSLANRKRTSAHYVIRSVDGEITQLVNNENRSTHACGRNVDKELWNDVAFGIEHEGRAAERGWQTEVLYKTSARLVAFLMKKFGIPAENILSHAEAFQIQKKYNGGGCDGRTDPGAGWDWTYFGELVNFFANPPSIFGSNFLN